MIDISKFFEEASFRIGIALILLLLVLIYGELVKRNIHDDLKKKARNKVSL